MHQRKKSVITHVGFIQAVKRRSHAAGAEEGGVSGGAGLSEGAIIHWITSINRVAEQAGVPKRFHKVTRTKKRVLY